MIIGIVGKARSGKDTLASYLLECFENEYKVHYKRMAFAKHLKDMCENHFELSHDQLYGDKKEIPDERFHKPFYQDPDHRYWAPREIMQELGSFYRKIRSDYWVESLRKSILRNGYENVIITDVRHINECNFVKNNKGILIKINRKDAEKIHGMQHESETALDKSDKLFDMTIDNSGTLHELKVVAQDIVHVINVLERTMKEGRVYDGK